MTESGTDLKSLLEDLEKESPGDTATRHVLEETEPSGSMLSPIKNTFFPHISGEIWNDWKWQFRNRITTVDDLAKFISLPTKEQLRLRLVIGKYPLAVTPYYLSLINPNDPHDPIRKQAVPSFREITLADVDAEDPLEERRNSVVPGLIHRYPDRALMWLTNICPTLCRHCTRKREWCHGGWVRSTREIEAIIDYVRRNKVIRDIIISGGDPLILPTHRLEKIIAQLRSIDHVEIIRIGTRFPVVLPQRIDGEFCNMLSRYGPIWLNTHFNHYREITPEAAAACDRLLCSGVVVSNQAVLLRGVNDTVKAQLKLCHELLRIKVRPYYLFQCDEVQGTAHLRTSVQVGVRIIEKMWGYTSGLAIPTFVVDLPGGGGKVPLQPNYMLSRTEEELILENYQGRVISQQRLK
ncbi:MAG: KamA family radical SAM protein [Dehalococcoidales bacterium]|nr:KamA family radical SAM protein [Dehalococcoidales bacterium]MDP7109827.1 KamA family radical SAM protein [Dehalococcoidales bacterium]MDP7409529.1 KamA family radical SAM protein [Dehalococcoidales bacterium]MDP7675864.1 KamA family radical SAM protein [Dehalococcoidales bacterium]HJM36591.1 KamA family radical SAM protein [Dehalococcoidales bacterium]